MFLIKFKKIHTTVKKAHRVTRILKGLKLLYAITYLEFSKKKFARVLAKLLKNYINSFFSKKELLINYTNFYILSISVLRGPIVSKKRFFRARGNISYLSKKSIHVIINIGEKKNGSKS